MHEHYNAVKIELCSFREENLRGKHEEDGVAGKNECEKPSPLADQRLPRENCPEWERELQYRTRGRSGINRRNMLA